MIRRIKTLLVALLLSCSGVIVGLSQSVAAEPEANAYMLLNVESDGMLSVRDLVYTNIDTGAEVWIRDLLNLGRAGSRKYIMEPLPAGKYYLSSIFPNINVNDTAPRIDVDVGDGVITILPDTINYIGNFIFESRERGRGVTSSFDYDPDSNTLIAALMAERALFESLDVAISIAGNAPVAVDKKLLGL